MNIITSLLLNKYIKKYWGTALCFIAIAQIICIIWVETKLGVSPEVVLRFKTIFSGLALLVGICFTWLGYSSYKRQENVVISILAASICSSITIAVIYFMYNFTVDWIIKNGN